MQFKDNTPYPAKVVVTSLGIILVVLGCGYLVGFATGRGVPPDYDKFATAILVAFLGLLTRITGPSSLSTEEPPTPVTVTNTQADPVQTTDVHDAPPVTVTTSAPLAPSVPAPPAPPPPPDSSLAAVPGDRTMALNRDALLRSMETINLLQSRLQEYQARATPATGTAAAVPAEGGDGITA